MGFSLPPTVIILIIMIGACMLTCLGYAVHKIWGFGEDSNGFRPMSVAQMEYMAEVRVHNLQVLENESRLARGGKSTQMKQTIY
ncbi:hypothetical protein GQ44DRAFT_608512 [Phaeosphaeriaceae sp. PMI808]|nr:hypothetical protein GQ44DRAFT_608512 [Phaeosphaeriaceae sp. PMI808]